MEVWLTIIPEYMALVSSSPLWTFDAWVQNLVNCVEEKSYDVLGEKLSILYANFNELKISFNETFARRSVLTN